MAEQVSEQRKIELVNKINERYQNLMHDVNQAEQLGIRVVINVDVDPFNDGSRMHRMTINCLDTHLMEKAKDLKTDT